MWTIGRSQRGEGKKYRPIVHKLRYILFFLFFFSDAPHLAPVAIKCISIIKKVYQNTHEIKEHKL